VRAFLTSEGFDVLGIESLDTGMTSLEKAMLSPTQVFRHVRTEKMYRESFLGRKIVGQTWLDCNNCKIAGGADSGR
jgi:hypothetical protein